MDIMTALKLKGAMCAGQNGQQWALVIMLLSEMGCSTQPDLMCYTATLDACAKSDGRCHCTCWKARDPMVL